VSVYIIIVDYLAPLAEVDQALDAHRDWVKAGYADGLFLLSGPQSPRVGGAILAHDIDRAALDARLAQDPFAIAGVARHRVIELAASSADPRLAFLLG